MRVFIVDDEFYIVEMLKKLIEWDELGLSLAGVAMDGKSALEKICDEKPEIIITDIRMPSYDGISLIEKVQESKIEACWIIISGHKQFDYAISALKHGVRDYLLKPINGKELNDLLRRVVKEYQKAEKEAEKKEFISGKRALLLPSIMNHTIDFDSDMETINEKYETVLSEGFFQWLVVRIDWQNGNLDAVESQAFESVNQSISNCLQELFREKCSELLISFNYCEIFGLLNYNALSGEEIDKFMHVALKKAMDILDKFCSPQVTFSVSPRYEKIEDSYEYFLLTRASLRKRILAGTNSIIYSGKSNKNYNEILKKKLDFSTKRALTNMVEGLKLSEYEKAVKKLFREEMPTDPDDVELYWVLCESIFSFFWEIAQQMGIQGENIPSKEALIKMMWECTNVNALVNGLLLYTSQHFNKYYNFDNSCTSASVTVAKKYVSEHYAEKITLKDIGELVFLNPIYFSLLFKKETGMNFTDYVNEYRIDVAKKMLKELRYSVAEIAEQVGISNGRYFSQLFRKHVGVTPKQYRNIQVNTENVNKEAEGEG